MKEEGVGKWKEGRGRGKGNSNIAPPNYFFKENFNALPPPAYSYSPSTRRRAKGVPIAFKLDMKLT